MLRPASPADRAALLAVAASTGIFAAGEAEALLGSALDDLHSGVSGPDFTAVVWIDPSSGKPGGWVYFSPDTHSDRAWQLWWIGVAPDQQKRGIGSMLLKHVEQVVRDRNGKVLLIETSSLPGFTNTQLFYTRHGYRECGRIPDYYDDGDSKVIFAKSLGGAVA